MFVISREFKPCLLQNNPIISLIFIILNLTAMKLLKFLLFVLLCLPFTINSQSEEKGNFPDDYFGVYKGTLNISSAKGPSTYPMEFHLLPTDSIGKYHYILIYGEGDMRQERKYTLLELWMQN